MARRTRRKEQSCVYCGTTGILTDEHVVPKGMFPRPRPTNLIKVPACDSCNQSYKKDDEFFRLAIAGRSSVDLVGRQIWHEKVIGSTLKRSPGLSTEMVSRLIKIELKTPAGLYLGTRDAVLLNLDRVNRVIEKTVRGLYFHHEGTRLPPDVNITIRYNPDLAVLEFLLPGLVLRSVGDGSVFQYRYGIVTFDPNVSFWFLRFYSTVVFGVFTGLARKRQVVQVENKSANKLDQAQERPGGSPFRG